MSDYAFQLDAVGLEMNEHVNLDLLSKTVRDASEMVRFISQHRSPFYMAYYLEHAHMQAALRDAARLRALDGLAQGLGALLTSLHQPSTHRWADLEAALHMPVIPLTHFQGKDLFAEVNNAVAAHPGRDVCFIDVREAESALKGIDAPTLEDLSRQLGEAIVSVDIQSNALAKAAVDALLRTAPEAAAGWADDTPDLESTPAAPPAWEVATRTRDRLLAKETWFDSKEVAIRARSAVVETNPAQYASRLRREGRLFGVRWRGEYLHPQFQFQPSGNVHPAMARLLAVLPTTDANWNAAFWLFEPTGKLGGRRPADVFAADPEAVIAAAAVDFARDDVEGTPVAKPFAAGAHGRT